MAPTLAILCKSQTIKFASKHLGKVTGSPLDVLSGGICLRFIVMTRRMLTARIRALCFSGHRSIAYIYVLAAIIMKHRDFPASFFRRDHASSDMFGEFSKERSHVSWIIRACAILLVFSLNLKTLYCQSSKDTTIVIYFRSADFKLNPSQIAQIKNFENAVTGVKSIVGYADSIGTTGYNNKLSKMRAFNVYQTITQRFKPLYPYSYKGEEFNQNPDLSLNRKVEIVGFISKGPQPTEIALKDRVLDSFEIENLNFVPDKAILTPESIDFIPMLVQKVKSYRDARFDIIGHVNYQSTRDSSHIPDLYRLSEERAKVVYQILIENGIAGGLLRYKGVGNSQPLIKNPKNEFEKGKNMRVQIYVLAGRQNN